MAFDLKLRVEELPDGRVAVTWQEPRQNDAVNKETLKTPLGYTSLALVLGGLILPFLAGSWVPLILFPLGIAVIAFEMTRNPSQKSVVFGPDETEFNGQTLPTNRITRIAIDMSLQWTALSEHQKKKEKAKTQILFWLDDEQPIEISRNNLAQDTAFVIRNKLDEALQQVRKSAVQTEREAVQGKTGDFGVPDY